jgi:hypothetical protein
MGTPEGFPHEFFVGEGPIHFGGVEECSMIERAL